MSSYSYWNKVLQDLSQSLIQDIKVLLTKTLATSCQELIKNLPRSSADFVGIYIHDLGKFLIKSYRTLPILLLKYDITRSCTRSYTRSLGASLVRLLKVLIKNVLRI